jgi:hypothetical protein
MLRSSSWVTRPRLLDAQGTRSEGSVGIGPVALQQLILPLIPSASAELL